MSHADTPYLAQDERFPSDHHGDPRPVMCQCCGEAEPFDGVNDCCKCFVAYLLHEDPDGITEMRQRYAGTRELAIFNREVDRQATALVSSGLMLLTVPVATFSAEALKGLGINEEVDRG